MSSDERRLRADAERNRKRLIEAAAAVFRERGLDVGVAEIAERAGVGRGTVFRNFASKEDLIAAVVIERMKEAAARGRALLDAPDAGASLFEFLEEMTGRQQLDRGMFEALADTWLANDEIRAQHVDVLGVLDALLTRAKQTGAVRDDVTAIDVLMLFKGVCEAASAFAHIEPGMVARQLDLVRAALSPSGAEQPLRGRAPSLEDIDRAYPKPQTGKGAAARARG